MASILNFCGIILNPILFIKSMHQKFPPQFGLYFLTDSTLTKIPVEEQVKQALKARIKVIQYREKTLSTKEQYNQALTLRKLTKGKALLIINDRIDICMAVNADGVHLGKEDIPCKYARKILKDKIIGLSTHNLQEAIEAEKIGADYIAVGPIFPTETKKDHEQPVEIDNLKEIVERIKTPLVAIGGINHANLKDVLSTGIKNFVIISAIMKDGKIEENIKNARRLYHNPALYSLSHD